MANTKAIFYRLRKNSIGQNLAVTPSGNVTSADLKTGLRLFLGTGDSNVDTNATSIAAGTGFTSGTDEDGVALVGLPVAYAIKANPVILDPQTNTYRTPDPASTAYTLLWEDEPVPTVFTHLSLGSPVDDTVDYLLASTAITALPVVSTVNPDVARVVSLTGNASSSSVITLAGKSAATGLPITEDITLNSTATVNGTLAFGPSPITFTLKTAHTGDTFTAGVTDLLGLGVLLSRNTVIKTYLGNTLEATAPTVTVNSTNIDKNVLQLNSDLNTTQVDVYLSVN